MVLTEASGQVSIEVSRDRDGSFERQIVREWEGRLAGGCSRACPR